MITEPKTEYLFKIENAPHHADPIYYDYFTHHATFRSVLGGLVSRYRMGGYYGILAENWSASDDYKSWTFQIRKGLTFEDGTPITAEDVVRSWARLAVILRQKDSYSEFFSALPKDCGNDLTSLRGVTGENNLVRIELERPLRHLLNIVSFGIYSIVSQNDYDPGTGVWNDPRRVTSSHEYAVAEWEATSLTLRKRSDFVLPNAHLKMLPAVKFVWTEDVELQSVDIIYGHSTVQYPPRFRFSGAPPSYFAYAYCVPYKNKNSFCSDPYSRRWLKHEVLRRTEETETHYSQGFFPLITENSPKFKLEEVAAPADLPKQVILSSRKYCNPLIDRFIEALTSTLGQSGVSVIEAPFDYAAFDACVDSGNTLRAFDLFISYTGISIDNPTQDLRFMFKSKEGVRLPDLDGSIHSELSRETVSPGRLEQLLWDQDLVWPIGHFSIGTWFSDEIDDSLLNPVQPPIELVWIGTR